MATVKRWRLAWASLQRITDRRQDATVGIGVKSLLVSGNKWQQPGSSIEDLSRKLLEPARGVEPPTC